MIDDTIAAIATPLGEGALAVSASQVRRVGHCGSLFPSDRCQFPITL